MMTPRTINEKAEELALQMYAKTLRMADDLIIEAVGNDDGECADSIRAILFNEDRDNWPELIDALKTAFRDYTLTDKVYAAAEDALLWHEQQAEAA